MKSLKFTKTRSENPGTITKCAEDLFSCQHGAQNNHVSRENLVFDCFPNLPSSVGNILVPNTSVLEYSAPDVISLFVILKMIIWDTDYGRNQSKQICGFPKENNDVILCHDKLQQALDTIIEKEEVNADTMELPCLSVFKENDTRPYRDHMESLLVNVSTVYKSLIAFSGKNQTRRKSTMANTTKGNRYFLNLKSKLYEANRKLVIIDECQVKRIRRSFREMPDAKKSRTEETNLVECPFQINPPCKNGKEKIIDYAIAIMSENIEHLRHMNSSTVGLYATVKKYSKKSVTEANHVPATQALQDTDIFKRGCNNFTGKDGMVAHSIPYGLHQVAMRFVGTSGRRDIAVLFRRHETLLLKSGNMTAALLLDIIGSYGRANIYVNVADASRIEVFKPAFITYLQDLHAIINEHCKCRFILPAARDFLHEFLVRLKKYWEMHPTANQWIDCMDNIYVRIMKDNNIRDERKFTCLEPEFRVYG